MGANTAKLTLFLGGGGGLFKCLECAKQEQEATTGDSFQEDVNKGLNILPMGEPLKA